MTLLRYFPGRTGVLSVQIAQQPSTAGRALVSLYLSRGVPHRPVFVAAQQVKSCVRLNRRQLAVKTLAISTYIHNALPMLAGQSYPTRSLT